MSGDESCVVAAFAVGRSDSARCPALAGESGDHPAPDSPQSAIAASEAVKRWCTLPQHEAFAGLVSRLIADAVEIMVLLIDAPRPTLCASTRLVPPLQGARSANRECTFTGEVEQRD